MWEQVRPADVEAAKASLDTRLKETLLRHQQEIKALQDEAGIIANAEYALSAFAAHYQAPVVADPIAPVNANEIAGLTRRVVTETIQRDELSIPATPTQS